MQIVNSNEIINSLNEKVKMIHLENYEIIGDLDFTEVTNAKKPNKKTSLIETSIMLISCIFKGNVIAYSNDINLIFNGDVNFSNSTFEKDVDFSKSVFQEQSNFDDTIFMNKAFFIKTTFKQKANFKRASFTNNINFKDAIFEQSIEAKGSVISKNKDELKKEKFLFREKASHLIKENKLKKLEHLRKEIEKISDLILKYEIELFINEELVKESKILAYNKDYENAFKNLEAISNSEMKQNMFQLINKLKLEELIQDSISNVNESDINNRQLINSEYIKSNFEASNEDDFIKDYLEGDILKTIMDKEKKSNPNNKMN